MDIRYFLPGVKVAELEALHVRFCNAEVKINVSPSTSLRLTFVWIATYFKRRHNPPTKRTLVKPAVFQWSSLRFLDPAGSLKVPPLVPVQSHMSPATSSCIQLRITIHPPCWKTTLSLLSTTAYSTCFYLSSLSGSQTDNTALFTAFTILLSSPSKHHCHTLEV